MHADPRRSIRLQSLRETIDLHEDVVRLIAGTVAPPIFYDSGVAHFGFRFTKPDWKHFCLLKSVRAVSGMNACFAPLPGGFSQEIAVIVRSVVECTTHIDYVLAGLSGDNLAKSQADYVELFFSDFQRNSVSDFKRPTLRQGTVHKVVGAETDQLVGQIDRDSFSNVDSAKLMSNVYLSYSNFVHSRYPEVMDLYGGKPPHFHLRGMPDTPRNGENLETIECFGVTVSNALKFMVLRMHLVDKVQSIEHLALWFKNVEAKPHF